MNHQRIFLGLLVLLGLIFTAYGQTFSGPMIGQYHKYMTDQNGRKWTYVPEDDGYRPNDELERERRGGFSGSPFGGGGFPQAPQYGGGGFPQSPQPQQPRPGERSHGFIPDSPGPIGGRNDVVAKRQSSRVTGKTSNQSGNTWTEVGVLDRNSAQWQVSLSVGRVVIPNGNAQGYCTGTMISPSHAIFNSHCNGHGGNRTQGIVLQFGYQESIPENERETYNCARYMAHDQNLDVLVVQCDGEPGRKWGWVELERNSISEGDRVYIVHHPQAQTKRYTTGSNRGNRTEGGHWQDPYIWTNSCIIQQGSSGSLTFSMETHKAVMINHGSQGNNEIPCMGTASWAVVDFIEKHLGRDFWQKSGALSGEQSAPQVVEAPAPKRPKKSKEGNSQGVSRTSTPGQTFVWNNTGNLVTYYTYPDNGGSYGPYSVGAGEQADFSQWCNDYGINFTIKTEDGREYRILKDHTNTIR